MATPPTCGQPTPPIRQPDLRMPLPGGKAWLLETPAGTKPGLRHYSLTFSPQTEGLPGQPPVGESDVQVLAAAGGTVRSVGHDDAELGSWVWLDHGEGFSTIYGHLEPASIGVAAAQEIPRGYVLGRMGSSGAPGTRLHFELRYFDQGDSRAVWLDQIVMEGNRIIDYASGNFMLSSNPPVAAAAARLAITPGVAVLGLGATQALSSEVFSSGGGLLPGAAVTWKSVDPSRATVDNSGVVTGVSAGAARIVATSGSAADTATVAVVAATSLLSTAYFGSDGLAELMPGQKVSVPIHVDMSRAGTDGDLGAAQFKLLFDAGVLQYDSASVMTGSVGNHSAAGEFSFAFAGVDPQGGANVLLSTVHFTVHPDAAPGTMRTLGLAYTARPSTTNFVLYDVPVVVGGRFRIAVP
jgi:murein DD-endopeptidase MepM/ murein hydrolase activator NlpD